MYRELAEADAPDAAAKHTIEAAIQLHSHCRFG
jgi:hypothetical protein